jgi:hypothetical protein
MLGGRPLLDSLCHDLVSGKGSRAMSFHEIYECPQRAWFGNQTPNDLGKRILGTPLPSLKPGIGGFVQSNRLNQNHAYTNVYTNKIKIYFFINLIKLCSGNIEDTDSR